MRAGSAVESLASALYHALAKDLPDIEYEHVDFVTKQRVPMVRRPHEDDVKVFHFPQSWGDTSLGFGGVAGQATTTAYTTVVHCHPNAVVYFAGRFAYRVKHPGREFWDDVRTHNMAAVDGARKYLIEKVKG